MFGLPYEPLGEVVAAVLTRREDLDRARVRSPAPRSPGCSEPRRWFHLAELPLTAAGKVDRVALRATAGGGRGGSSRSRRRREVPDERRLGQRVAPRSSWPRCAAPIGTSGSRSPLAGLSAAELAAPVVAAVAGQLRRHLDGSPDDVVLGNCMGPGGDVARVADPRGRSPGLGARADRRPAVRQRSGRGHRRGGHGACRGRRRPGRGSGVGLDRAVADVAAGRRRRAGPLRAGPLRAGPPRRPRHGPGR